MAQYDSYRSKNSRNKQDRGGSEKARCSQSETLLSHHRLNRPDIPMLRVWKSAAGPSWTELATSAPTGSTKHNIIIIITEEVMVIIGNAGRTASLLECTQSADNLFHSFTVLWEKENFLTSNLPCPFSSVKSCPLVVLILKHILGSIFDSNTFDIWDY